MSSRRSRWTRQALVVLLACAMLSAAALAADRPNFSGQWKLNLDQSNFGPVQPPDSASYRIQHDGATLVLDYIQDDRKTHAEVNSDGEERVTESNRDSEIWTRIYWAGPVLVFESREKARPAHESHGLKWTSRWSVSDDGKTFVILKHFTTPQGEFDQKLVFDKQ